jgi:hypothetical protein
MTVSDFFAALKTAGEKASGVTSFSLDESERRKAIELALDYGAPRLLAAWILFQKEKQGKPFRFFAEDLPQFMPRVKENDIDKPERPSILMDCPVCGTTYQKLRRGGCPFCEEHGGIAEVARSLEDVQEDIS